tara:strand:- start:333 stop:446 length:114 start_codon:yes stop_codon:yes gene_type:complete
MEECIECHDDENATWITPEGYAICIKCIREKEQDEEM